ncbi:AAA family ATPase [Devosia oryziradicis]|uniref:AAA family ATPase n=1 Tax=Devosia oryziradicis TaxID=2801335 RepID=A0ABX7BWH9_9HYPH|nr:AAA family ATPase [Devosia oryziradicis]QQR36304.1 AAA family ATPase [Devosia oryziradicis]
MRISFFRVEGFQGFSNSGTVELTKGINLVVGQNNSGKSALLRSLHSLSDDRHKNASAYEDHFLASPKLTLAIVLTGFELRDALLRAGSQFHIPVPQTYHGRAGEYADKLLNSAEVLIALQRYAGNANFQPVGYPSHTDDEFTNARAKVSVLMQGTGGHLQAIEQTSSADGLPDLASQVWNRKLFHFDAERMNVGRYASENHKRLGPSAANLPAVLATLRFERPALFDRLVSHLRDVLPTVGGLSVGPAQNQGNTLEIRVWPTDNQERVELSFPLSSSGTGVSQVLAILTAVMTVDDATIVIDEINSFLHPAAVKALLRILQTDFAQHQYIISTHSADVIGASGATTLHLVRREGYQSVVTPLNISKIDELRDLTGHLGVSLSDVLAAERILWVEGPTEELCFPRLYELATSHSKPRGTVISAVATTGDLTRKRDQELVSEIYQKVSEAALVVAAATCLDREQHSADEQADMNRKARGRLFFLPRRHIECYLVDPEAIAAFINARDIYEGTTVDASAVAQELARLASTAKHKVDQWKDDLTDESWLTEVDAANLIAATCTSMSEARVAFNKKKDSEFLMLHMLEHSPARLEKLARFVRETVDTLQTLPPLTAPT